MSEINSSNFKKEHGDLAPDLVGVTELTSPYFFVPPSGDTASRPEDCEPGTLRFNTDIGSLEIFRGKLMGWEQIQRRESQYLGGDVVSSTGGDSSNFGTGTRGIFFGGNNGSTYDDIEFITISTLGNTADFGNLTQNKLACGTCGSRTRGIAAAGQTSPGYSNVINFITFSSTGNASDFGDTTSARDFLGGLSNQTRGLFFGGRNPGALNIIDYITISQTGNAVDFGDLLSTRNNYCMGAASTTRGLMATGVGSPSTKEIDFVTIATTGNGQDFGDTTVIQGGAGASNSTRAIFAGGYIVPAKGNVIEFATIATLGNSVDFGDLTSARRGLGGAASSTRACFAGGQTSEDVNTIDFIEIATTGNASDFGDLTLASSSNGKKKNVSGCSNGHGGL